MLVVRVGAPNGLPPAAVAIGTFDGVHLGHRAVLGWVRRKAEDLGTGTTVITFDRHPRSVVGAGGRPAMLMTVEQKLEALAASGLVDHVLLVPFDRERSRQEAAQFVAEVITGLARARSVVVGQDFRFGAGRSGTVDTLRRLGRAWGFSVEACPPVADGTEHRCSSTLVRGLVAAGDLATAQRLLGRPFEVACDVVPAERADDGPQRWLSLRARPFQCLPPGGSYVGELCETASGLSLSPCRARVVPASGHRRAGLAVACDEPVALSGAEARFRFGSSTERRYRRGASPHDKIFVR